MEFLEENSHVKESVLEFMTKIENIIARLKKTDVESFRRRISEAPGLESKSRIMRRLLEENVPASVDLLDSLLQKSKTDRYMYLEWMSHRQNAAMSFESFSKARSFAEEAHATAKKHFEGEGTNSSISKLREELTYKSYIKACVDSILVCRYQAQLADAQTYLEEAKAVATTKDDRDTQHLLLILHGDILTAKGQVNKAIETVFKPLLQTPSISRHNRGLLLQKLGNACRNALLWGPAKDYLSESIAIAQEEKDRISEFDRVADLGNVYRSEGRIAEALEQHVPHLDFALNRGDLWGITIACYNMGFAYYSITPNPDYRRALVLLSLKYYLASRTDNVHFIHMALNNLGKTFCGLKQYEAALKVMGQSVEVARKTSNLHGEGMAYGNIGTAYRSLGKYEDAIEYHKKYLEIANLLGDYGGAAYMRRELAIDYVCKGDFENAEKQLYSGTLLRFGESIRSKLGEEDASKISNYDKNQSEIYNLVQIILARRGKHAEALVVSEMARSRALTELIRDKLIKDSKTVPDSWIYATEFGSRWPDIQYDILSDYFKSADELNTNFLVYSVLKDYDSNATERLYLYIWLVLNEKAAKGQDRIRFKKIPLSENIQEEVVMVDNGFFASLTRAYKILSRNVSGTEFNIPAKVTTSKTARVKISENPDVEEFFQLIESLSPTKETPPTPNKNDEKSRKTNISDIGHLNNFRNIVQLHNSGDLAQTGNSGDIQVAQQDDFEDLVQPDNSGNLTDIEDSNKTGELADERADTKTNRYLDRGAWKSEGIRQMIQLYEACIAPINDYLPEEENGEVPNVTIIPYEFLFSVPFCCLHNGDNEYLIKRFVLSYAPSLRALLLLNQRYKYLKMKQQNRKLKILAMGNPDSMFATSLESSEDEARNVQAVFGPELCQLALRRDATKHLFLQKLNDVDILHVASHAFPQDAEVRDQHPRNVILRLLKNVDIFFKEDDVQVVGDYSMRGSLLLASSDEECEGIVNATEIASVDCKCQLVTLSCCETGLGKVTGDGVVGLYRAIFAAGAASALVTLWKIPDEITTKLMEHFYKEFKETGKVSRSLRAAMLKLIQEEKLPPQQWAAFSYIGAFS